MPTGSDYSRVDFSNRGNTADYKDRQSEGRTGEFSQYNPEWNYQRPEQAVGLENGAASPNTYGYGYDPNNTQFSSDKADTPEAMARETAQNQNAFANLQQYLNNSLDTPGTRVAHDRTKPWEPPAGEGE